MNNVYSVRIPTRDVQSVVALKPLVEHDGKPVPADKEIRISHRNWKTKELPGAGTSTARTRHLNAALAGLPVLLKKDLKDRNCSHVQSGIYNAVFGRDPGKVTAGPLRQLITVLESIDTLEKDAKLAKHRGADLLAHVVSDAAQLNVLSSLEARLKEAARILVKEGTMTSVADAWARSGIINEGEFTKPGFDLKKSPARAQKPHTPQVITPAPAASKPVATPVVMHEPTPAGVKAVRGLLRTGMDPVLMAATTAAQDKFAVLESLSHTLKALPPFDTSSEAEKLQWRRAAKFLEAWSSVGKNAPSRYEVADRAIFKDLQKSLDSAAKVNDNMQ